MSSPTDTVRIFDTTLRDGEQSPGIALNAGEKVEIARQLERLGVDIIEAGFPISSPGEFEGIRAVPNAVDCTVASLARTNDEDIDAAIEALRDARNPRIHIFIATSDIHREHKLRMTREQVLESATSRRHAGPSGYCSDVEFSPRGRHPHRPRISSPRWCEAAIAAGATTINIPDTVGYAMPEEYSDILRDAVRARPRTAQRRAVACTATTTSAWRSPTRWPACSPGRARWSARSTASASGRATRRWKRS